ncbi:hypothetical protein [Candidatus Accumulibacter sp. ACC007]|uniref:hypothetical protein n=1 Tax=Candidatus Accumulibacter sp. ACC007 TaxID=2823333 RepID=UPI0025BD64DB|nr:hypothetical protein [Candidatus Accumulibacter sp. ACC007]
MDAVKSFSDHMRCAQAVKTGRPPEDVFFTRNVRAAGEHAAILVSGTDQGAPEFRDAVARVGSAVLLWITLGIVDQTNNQDARKKITEIWPSVPRRRVRGPDRKSRKRQQIGSGHSAGQAWLMPERWTRAATRIFLVEGDSEARFGEWARTRSCRRACRCAAKVLKYLFGRS